MNQPDRSAKAELDRLSSEFFRAVSFENGGVPSYGDIAALSIERGLLFKNSSSTPEISSVRTSNGVPFESQGVITTQFITTPVGRRVSAMAWDDERPGLSISAWPSLP